MNKRKRSGIIWSISKEALTKLVQESICLGECLEKFGLLNKGNNCKSLKERLTLEEINFEHFVRQRRNLRGIIKKPLSYQEFIKLFKKYKDDFEARRVCKRIKQYNLKYNLIPNEKCSICGISEWNNLPLKLQLDHINGNSSDHTIENLRFVCPNCHSQTPNFAGKNKKRCEQIKNFCYCGREILKSSKKCIQCSGVSRRTCDRPSKEELKDLLEKYPATEIGKKFNVSSSLIKKWCKGYGIETKPRGFWSQNTQFKGKI